MEIKKKTQGVKRIKADAIITRCKGLGLAVVTADCVPIIIYDVKNKIIGCIHAGWKGAVSGIIKNTVSKIKMISSRNEIYASIGPCIGKGSYEVDLIFYRRFVSNSKKNNTYFLRKNKKKKLFDLRRYVSGFLLSGNSLKNRIPRACYLVAPSAPKLILGVLQSLPT